MTRLRMGKSVHRWEVVNPTDIRLRFVLVRVRYLSSSEAYTNNWGLFGKENELDFRLVKTFFENIKAFRSYDQFSTTT